jgi:hypothetical protein
MGNLSYNRDFVFEKILNESVKLWLAVPTIWIWYNIKFEEKRLDMLDKYFFDRIDSREDLRVYLFTHLTLCFI